VVPPITISQLTRNYARFSLGLGRGSRSPASILPERDFRDGMLTSESARKDLAVLAGTLLMLLRRLDPAFLGPLSIAAKFT